jgi:hypothetical protein
MAEYLGSVPSLFIPIKLKTNQSLICDAKRLGYNIVPCQGSQRPF